MAPPIRLKGGKLPPEAQPLKSIQEFKATCERAFQSIHPENSNDTVDLGEVNWVNDSSRFGEYVLDFQDPDRDFFCMGRVSAFHAEMDVLAGQTRDVQWGLPQKAYHAGLITLSDQCTLTRTIAGPGEFGGRACHEGRSDPGLISAAAGKNAHPLKIFEAHCSEALEKHILKTIGNTRGREFDLKRAFVDREQAFGDSYELRYENPESDFVCSAQVDLSRGLMMVTAGDGGPFSFPELSEYRLHQACALSEELKIPGTDPCEDKSVNMERADRIMEGLVGDLLRVAGAYLLYYKIPAWTLSLPGMWAAKKLGWTRAQRIFSHMRLRPFHQWRGNFSPVLNRSGVPVQKMTRLGEFRYKAMNPAVPGHLPAKWLSYGLRMMGLGFLLGTAYDGLAAQFVAEDHPLRSVGSPAVGLAGTAGLAVAEDIYIKRQLAKGIAAESLLTKFPKLGSLSRVANGFFYAWLFEKGMEHFVVGNDYEALVNRRVTEAIYDQDHVYDYWTSEDFVGDILFAWTKPVRGGARFIAPHAVEWAVSIDHSELVQKFKEEDRLASFEIKKGMKGSILALLHNDHFESEVAAYDEERQLFQSTGIRPYRQEDKVPAVLNFSYLRREVKKPNMFEESIALLVEEKGYDWATGEAGYKKEDLDPILRQVYRYRFQQQAKFLVLVPGPQNDWARAVFDNEGRLRAGHEGELMEELLGPQDHWGRFGPEIELALERTRPSWDPELAHTYGLEHG